MVLTNRTKVAIGVVGSTAAYDKMFSSVRTARRVGMLISASNYCESQEYFTFLVKKLTKYQWFDTPIEITPEIIQALYDNTHGIIDQLVSIYICMHIEYLSKTNRPKVDAAFINRVAQIYYPQMKKLLSGLNDPKNDRKIAELIRNGNKQLEMMQDKAQQKIAAKNVIDSLAEAIDIEALEKNILANITSVTDEYSTDTIHSAFVKVYSKANTSDEKVITRAVFKQLQKAQSDLRPKRKSGNKLPHAVMQQEIIASSSQQIHTDFIPSCQKI